MQSLASGPHLTRRWIQPITMSLNPTQLMDGSRATYVPLWDGRLSAGDPARAVRVSVCGVRCGSGNATRHRKLAALLCSLVRPAIYQPPLVLRPPPCLF